MGGLVGWVGVGWFGWVGRLGYRFRSGRGMVGRAGQVG